MSATLRTARDRAGSAAASLLASRRALVILLLAVAAAIIIATPVSRDETANDSARESTAPSTVPVSGSVGAAGGDDALVDPAVGPRPGDGEAFVAPDAGTGESIAREAEAADAAEAQSAGSPPVEGVGGVGTPVELGVKVIQSGSVGLEIAERDEFAATYERLRSLGPRMDGYVVDASRTVPADEDADVTGTVTLRVPSDRFEDALAALEELDGVELTRMDVRSQDVTQEYVDTESRLRHDRAVARRLEALLAEAKDVGEVLAVQARLDQVQQEIEVAQGRISYLDRLSALATIDVTLSTGGEPVEEEPEEDGEPWGVQDALDDAAHAFVDTLNAAIVKTGAALPWLLALGLVALAARGLVARRRRRTGTATPSSGPVDAPRGAENPHPRVDRGE